MLDTYNELIADQSFNYLFKKFIPDFYYIDNVSKKAVRLESVEDYFYNIFPFMSQDKIKALDTFAIKIGGKNYDEAQRCALIMKALFFIHCTSAVFLKQREIRISFGIPTFGLIQDKLFIGPSGALGLQYQSASVNTEWKSAVINVRLLRQNIEPLNNVKSDLLDTTLEVSSFLNKTESIEGLPDAIVESIVGDTVNLQNFNSPVIRTLLETSIKNTRD